ncbi:hypothetical protein GCM10023115_42690 [Pontixanthobacter gangjinensis]|uniref:Glycosyltransferase n=1 Tax=Christiangramia aestuarii TaxID=1028746 RepID=A0A7M3SYF8_9FLAO|nr:glycosyltransferase [Christiangramia aestuarii]MUP41639.1 glycosyltransferase [Christiangramia aestuarii]
MRNKIQEPTKNENMVIKFLILLGIFSILNFLFFFLRPEFHGNTFLFVLLAISLFYGMIKKLYLWYNYSNISVPQEPIKTREFSVDVLTTYFPGEPYQMTITTLEAILNISYPHETFLCDEADDPYLKEFCQKHGIHHITRDNRIDAKAGNINNALNKIARGEITVILDPDHIPDPDFLDRTIPYFSDPKIGFVQTVQGYYNTKETLVARGAAEQTFQFYGPMMMTLNSYGAVNAIGANCVFRREALDSIGGHAPGLCEDMHTAMKLYAKGWKGVYVPKILAQGLAPSNLTSYFKQQLKWARGTFDLLFKVYPKLFNKFTTRQKIHFGVLPLHYLSGLICLINFIIPIISLLFSITPWKGNVIDFALVILPVIMSSILIRTYIQKWVIERKERGFHIMGGLLEINTWWIYLLGFFYTLIDKNIPYLPTPKENEFATNLKIIIPNFVIALLSLLAIVIGLSRDFTPFMIVMSGFALFNAIIMILGIYLTVKVTNENNILKENLNKKVLTELNKIRFSFLRAGNSIFGLSRFLALPLLLIMVSVSLGLKQKNDQAKWDDISSRPPEFSNEFYLGIYHPDRDTGTVAIQEIRDIEQRQEVNFDIISFYIGWDISNKNHFPVEQLEAIQNEKAVPMITWEPWIKIDSTIADKKETRSILKQISSGKFDDYIRYFGQELARYDKPVFLRFAHEFDNPQYPWSRTKGKLNEEFKAAWKHIFNLIKQQGAHKTIFVWNPWKSEDMHKFYPGDDYVDWVGITLLNYGILNQRGKNIPFRQLYQPFHDKLYWFTSKPVMLAEFGSIKYPEVDQSEWLKEASYTLRKGFSEISAVVFFNSAYDNNIPAGKIYLDKYIDWTTDSISLFQPEKSAIEPIKEKDSLSSFRSSPAISFKKPIKGVRYRKGIRWKDNYHVLSRKNLLRDFRLMQENGINTILYPGGNVYDHNILKYSEQEDIGLIYDFSRFYLADQLEDSAKMEETKQEILEKISELNEQPNITGFSFSFLTESDFLKPLLFQKCKKLLAWFTEVFTEIRRINENTPLILNVELNKDTNSLIGEIEKTLSPDYYGLEITNHDLSTLKQIRQFAEENDLQTFVSSIPPIDYSKQGIEKNSFILENWQDERYSNGLSFNGLLDFEGRKKQVFKKFDDEDIKNENAFRILKPAIPLLEGNKETFHALIYYNNNWSFSKDVDYDGIQFEWSLIKTDEYGNDLALKKLGKGPFIRITIPGDYQNYKLLLSVIREDSNYVEQSFTSLHTPLKKELN